MNKEELICKLQMVYVGDKNALNEMAGYYDGLKQGNEFLKQENKQLKEVINKAIEYINKCTTDENGDIGINLFAYEVTNLLDILKGEKK